MTKRNTVLWTLLAIGALLAWKITGDAATEGDLLERLEGPSPRHLLGTDQFGRDVLFRLVHGAVPTITLGALVLMSAAAVGTILGLVAAAKPGVIRSSILSTTDTLLALPAVFVALAINLATGPGTLGLVVSLVAVAWTPFCRLVYQLAIVVKEHVYVEAARAGGVSERRVYLRHILPNVAPPLLAGMAVRSANTLLSISALSYLGLGPQPPSADWGATLSAAQPYAERAPWSVAAPAFAIMATAIGAMSLSRRLQKQP